jgi:hypothetical protein
MSETDGGSQPTMTDTTMEPNGGDSSLNTIAMDRPNQTSQAERSAKQALKNI